MPPKLRPVSFRLALLQPFAPHQCNVFTPRGLNIPWTHQHERFYWTRRPSPQYERFRPVTNFSQRWRNSASFRYAVGGVLIGSIVFVIYNLERVPISGRLRFNYLPKKWEQRIGEEQYNRILRDHRGRFLPPNSRLAVFSRNVLDKLLLANRLDAQNWKVMVIDDDETVNAYVFPGCVWIPSIF